ncbi:MAG: hypothetical protein H6Q55_2145, partial [Deltaproteobacteria bacterium]|nr:hypothetical protein [Deltaproteobacteria bacterium]
MKILSRRGDLNPGPADYETNPDRDGDTT